MLNTTQNYNLITKDLPRALNTIAAKPEVKRETAYYLDNIGKIKTIDDFVNNQRVFTYAMKAFGLDDMIYAKALVKKALKEGIEKPEAFANRLLDSRLKEFITAFNFQRRGEYTTTFDEAKQGTVDKYKRQLLEEQAGQQNEGVRLALYFERKASGITDAFSILADKNLLRIVQTALDIPASSSSQNIDKQAQMIESKMKIADLKTPAKLKSFLNRFMVKWEMANPSGGGAAMGLSPFATPSTGFAASSVSPSVLAAIQNLKPRG